MTTPTTDSGTPAGSANQLQRVLKARHLTMIALGGAIGTGLFIASGAAIAEAGPGGALLVYLVIGLMVYFIMTSLGELATFMPVSGSFCTYASRYVDPGFGFALGWTFWATVVPPPWTWWRRSWSWPTGSRIRPDGSGAWPSWR